MAIYFDDSAELAVNEPSQQVTWSTAPEKFGEVQSLRIGSVDQPVLAKRGDDLRIDWGYLYTARHRPRRRRSLASPRAPARNSASAGQLESPKDLRRARSASDAAMASVVFDLGKVSETPVERLLMLRLRRRVLHRNTSAKTCAPTGGETEPRRPTCLEGAARRVSPT